MQRIDGQLVLSPTDLTRHQECRHLTALDLQVADEARPKPIDSTSEELELIFRLGLAHEHDYLDQLRREGRSIEEIPTAFDGDGRRAAEAATVTAMRAGVDVVYQGTFFDGVWGGQADFLLRVDRPSALGEWSYDIADTKLARKMKVPALLQMATYAERLAVLQGTQPQHLYVVTGGPSSGDKTAREWRLVDVGAYARRARARLSEFVQAPPATEPVPVAHCGQCRWESQCTGQLRRRDDLSLVAFMRRDHRDALRAVGIHTMPQLAGATDADFAASRIGSVARTRLREQAQEQVAERRTGRPSYRLTDVAPGMGLLRLPPPSPGDLYFDFEGDPYFSDGESLEYLVGIGDRATGFTTIWAHDRDAERDLVRELVDRLTAAAAADPDMHVYHYAPYEVTALKKLTARYGVREAELDSLLRAERFVDLYPVVRQGLRISKESYSIKKVEAFYGRHHDGAVADAMSSVLSYERWIAEPDPDILHAIEAYNRDDVDSTRELHDWLEERRAELEARDGAQPRPVPKAQQAPTAPGPDEQAEIDATARLQAAGHELLGDLVQYHRREARPGWWDFFRLADLEDDELVEDGSSLGALAGPVDIGPEKRSRLYRYTFTPQDTRLKVGQVAVDVDSRDPAGTVHALDPVGGIVVLKRQGQPPSFRGLGPKGPINDGDLRSSIRSTGDDVLAGRPALGAALIERRVPAGTQLTAEEAPSEAVLRVGRRLSGDILAIQGPPGSGKTTAAAQLIRRLLDDGLRVGVTANSHAVIGHLLTSVGRPAMQKCKGEQWCGDPAVRWSDKAPTVAGELTAGTANLVGGTAWFWAHADAADTVDVLVVDEAGQFPLANAVASARAARSMVLLGDPQQLASPSQALHPRGSGASALEHFLGDHATIPEDRGIFLDRTHRMHPALTAFVSDLAYDGRLRSAEGLDRVQVAAGGMVSGSGLVVAEVRHAFAASASSEQEADAVAQIWRSLQGVEWTNRSGNRAPLTPDDVLVVAPYNNQVGLIRDRLPGARVGTVDKFQGQEAAVVIYSMTSTSAAEAPRGVAFLYDLHRLNVAVSRAKALAVVVMSPELLDAPARTTEQLRQVSALCRLHETATVLRL